MRFGVTFSDRQVGRRYLITMDGHARRTRRALTAAAEDVRDLALREGRANIASAGRFGHRWTEGFKGTISSRGNAVNIDFTHDIPYWSVFQFGKIIHGRPMLWIPFSFARDAQGIRARDYGPLFKVVRRRDNLPMLWSVATREPKYFGKESVTIPKKFKLLEIIRASARQIRSFFTRHANG